MEPKPAPTAAQKVGISGKRSPRSIRFSDREWIGIETAAAQRGITAGELVRAAAIAAAAEGPVSTGSGSHLVAQIDPIFRYMHILATELRNRMLAEGRDEEMEDLVRSARALQDDLRQRPLD